MASPFLTASSSSSASSPLSYLIPRPSSSSLVPQGFSCGGAALAQQQQQAGVFGGLGFGGAVPAGGVEAVRQGGRHAGHPPLPRPPPRQCPRCRSANTKFCYYNNYSRKQPRYFCRACRRHWTEGGTLRDVPVGGGRKNRRNGRGKAGAKAPSTTTTATATASERPGHEQLHGRPGQGRRLHGSAPGSQRCWGGSAPGSPKAPSDAALDMSSFTAVDGGGGYSIDLSAWQQMAAATTAPQGASDVGAVGGTAPTEDANCGAGVQFWSGWQAQDDMSGFDAPF